MYAVSRSAYKLLVQETHTDPMRFVPCRVEQRWRTLASKLYHSEREMCISPLIPVGLATIRWVFLLPGGAMVWYDDCEEGTRSEFARVACERLRPMRDMCDVRRNTFRLVGKLVFLSLSDIDTAASCLTAQ